MVYCIIKNEFPDVLFAVTVHCAVSHVINGHILFTTCFFGIVYGIGSTKFAVGSIFGLLIACDGFPSQTFTGSYHLKYSVCE